MLYNHSQHKLGSHAHCPAACWVARLAQTDFCSEPLKSTTVQLARMKRFNTCLKMYITASTVMVVLLCMLEAAAARQLDGDAVGPDKKRIKQAAEPTAQSPLPTYISVFSNSSCHGFLVGIGTQKGGTTALWAYIADNTHPHLRVAKTKELGFWDNLHTRYSGCRVGDYLQLQTMDEPEAVAAMLGQQQGKDDVEMQRQLPVCKSVSAHLMQPDGQQQSQPGGWSTSSAARLLPSQDCSIQQSILKMQDASRLLSKAQARQGSANQLLDSGSSRSRSSSSSTPATASLSDLSGGSTPLGSFHLHNSRCPEGLYLPGDVIPPKPCWWLWGRWPQVASADPSCIQQRSNTAQQPTEGASQSQQFQQLVDTTGSGPAPVLGSARLLLQQADSVPELLQGLQDNSPSVMRTAGRAPTTVLGAPAQLQLGAAHYPQPIYHADITPRYLLDPAVPPRVQALLPEARIIVILRDPVSRAISNFNMWWQKHVKKNSTTTPAPTWSETLAAQIDSEIARLTACYNAVGSAPAMQPELSTCLGLQHPFTPAYDEALFANRLLAQGIYAEGLQRWFQLFPAESFLIWVSEDFKSQPAVHMRHLVEWLGLDPDLLDPKLRAAGSNLKPVHGRHYEGSADADVVARMRQFFAPHNERLFALLASKGFGAVAERMRSVWPL